MRGALKNTRLSPAPRRGSPWDLRACCSGSAGLQALTGKPGVYLHRPPSSAPSCLPLSLGTMRHSCGGRSGTQSGAVTGLELRPRGQDVASPHTAVPGVRFPPKR